MQHDGEGSGAVPPGDAPGDFPERTRPAASAAADSTGDRRVDEAVAALGRLAELPPDAHVAVFDDVHASLCEVLSELDSAPPDTA